MLARGSSVDDDDTWALAIVNGKARLASRHLGTGMTFLEAPGTISLNQWTHLAVSFDGFNRRIYVNGVEVNSDRFLGPLVYDPAAVPVTIGSDWAANASTERFTGRIDEVSLYDRALSAAEIAAIQANGPAGKAATQPYFTTPFQLPDAVVGDPYTRALTAAIGASPITFSVTGGALPPGLALSEAGAFHGTPLLPGDYAFTVVARDAGRPV